MFGIGAGDPGVRCQNEKSGSKAAALFKKKKPRQVSGRTFLQQQVYQNSICLVK